MIQILIYLSFMLHTHLGGTGAAVSFLLSSDWTHTKQQDLSGSSLLFRLTVDNSGG